MTDPPLENVRVLCHLIYLSKNEQTKYQFFLSYVSLILNEFPFN